MLNPKKYKLLLYPVLIAALLCLIFYSPPAFLKQVIFAFKNQLYPIDSIRVMMMVYMFLRVFLIIVVCGLFIFWFRGLTVSWGRSVRLVIYNVFIILMVLEAIFTLVPYNTNAFSLSQINWIAYNWGPINQYGYRDDEVEISTLSDKKVIVCLGDSYTAGAGIEDVEDRSSNILQAKLTQDYVVFNLGVPGANTIKELENLKAFPVKPDVLILQHSMNDLNGILKEKRFRYESESNIQIFLSPMFRTSYLVSFVYSMFPPESSEGTYEAYRIYLEEVFSDTEVMEKLHEQLQQVIDHCTIHNIELIVVLFPVLSIRSDRYFGHSDIYIDPIQRFFRSKGVKVLNMAPFVKDIPENDRTVNDLDTHPGEHIHRVLGEQLYKLITQEN